MRKFNTFNLIALFVLLLLSFVNICVKSAIYVAVNLVSIVAREFLLNREIFGSKVLGIFKI